MMKIKVIGKNYLRKIDRQKIKSLHKMFDEVYKDEGHSKNVNF